MNNIKNLINKLEYAHSLTLEEYLTLVNGFCEDALNYIAPKALRAKRSVYGDDIYIRGLIEISNICKNDCNYCGIRRGNSNCERYRLTEDEILTSCKLGYKLGFRTFVLQGGEDGYYTDDVICSVISKIKELYPKCAVTLSLGERSFESYKRLFDAGVDRYLLRHETIDKEHYNILHPKSMSYENRIKCLYNLKEIGYQTGCGFMVGSPQQTTQNIAKDLKFIEEFKPHMCGIGPFIPHKDTEYAKFDAGSASLTCYLLAIIRLIKPNILLPATTALATLSEDGRTRGILCGANVVMPNLSPQKNRAKYSLYDNKAFLNTEAAEGLKELKANLNKIGAKVVTKKGDIK